MLQTHSFLSHLTTGMPTVLCIDDSEQGLAIRKRLLELKGYTVLTAVTGQSGIDLAASNHVDAVILDYSMPGLNGEDVGRAIRSRWPDLPILMLSGYAHVPQSAQSLADAFVVKGTSPSELFSQLERLTGGESRQKATPGTEGISEFIKESAKLRQKNVEHIETVRQKLEHEKRKLG